MAEPRITFCRICEAGCGLVADVERGRVIALRPDEHHVSSRGFACVKGVRFDEVHHGPDRLRTPLKRVGGEFVPIGWAQAFDEIGARVRGLRRHSRRAIAAYMGNPAAFSLPHALFVGAFVEALGTPNAFSSGSQDCSNKWAAAQAMFGSPALQPIPDLERTSCLVLLGANPHVSKMSFVHAPDPMRLLRGIEARGGHVVSINPRRTETTRRLGEHVFIRPDTDVFLLLALARELLAGAEIDPRMAPHVEHEAELRAIVASWSPERAAQVSGVPAPAIRRLAGIFAAADGAAVYASTGVNQGRHGTLVAWLVNAINVISGNLDRRGGLLVPPGLSRAARMLELSGVVSRGARSRIGGFERILGNFPAAILPDEILTPGRERIRALFVSAGNPVLSCANSERMREALSHLDLLVCVDLFRNETGNLAHYILPATSWLERDDIPLSTTGFAATPYLQYAPAVVPPAGEARDEWWIFTRLARACGIRLFRSRLLQSWLHASSGDRLPNVLKFSPRRIFAMHAWAHGRSLATLERAPHGMLLDELPGADFVPRRLRRRPRKIDLAPASFVAAAASLERVHAEERASAGALKLIGLRRLRSHNSWMHNVAAFADPPAGNALHIHPSDAAARGLSDGARCRICSATGELEVPVRVTAALMPGTVALPHGWGHQASDGLRFASRTLGVNANVLTPDGPDTVERLSGMAHLTGVPVSVERATATSEIP